MKLPILNELNAARRGRRAAILVTDTETGATRLVRGEDASSDPLGAELARRLRSGRSGLLEDGRTFLNVQVPPARLVVIGAVHISQALAPIARIAGFDVTIVDPRTAFATLDRFPDVRLIAEWPEEALKEVPLDAFTALAADCFYIGALGSRKTHGRRVERLLEQGASAAGIDRIHAPIGIDIGAQSPAEIAVAILAEMIAALRRGRQAGRVAA